MRKKTFLVLFAVTLILSIYFAHPVKAVVEPGQVLCYCTWLGNCKASGGGALCAQSEPGGNIQCSDYNGNC